MRVEASNPLTPAVVVKLDRKVVPGCVEADDVEGWVKRMVPAPHQPEVAGAPAIVYLQGREGPLTEVVKGKVKLCMIKYSYDENGKVVPGKTKTVSMDWDVYLEQRKLAFAQIHKGDTKRMKEATAALDEWYGKAMTQDAEARAEQAKAEEGEGETGKAGEGEGPAQGAGQGDDSRDSHAKTATRSPADSSLLIGKGG